MDSQCHRLPVINRNIVDKSRRMRRRILGQGLVFFMALCAGIASADISPPQQPGYSPESSTPEASQMLVVYGDFNGDEKNDQIQQSRQGYEETTLTLHESDDEVSQEFSPYYLGFLWDAEHHVLIPGDFDGDGRDDVFLQGVGTDSSSGIVLSDESGLLTRLGRTYNYGIPGIEFSADSHRVVVGDFNGDGYQDLILQGRNDAADSGYFSGVLLSARGEFDTVNQGWERDYLDVDWSDGAHRIYAGDFNGDGSDDLFLLGLTTAAPSYVLLSHEGRFESVEAQVSTTQDMLDDGVITLQDTDGDGRIEVRIKPKNTPEGNGHAIYVYAPNVHVGAQTAASSESDESEILPLQVEDGAEASLVSQAAAQSSPNQVGTTAGQFRVDESGSATYSIGIMTAPSSGHVAPQIAISYSSTAGNGLLGQGWSLSGLSAISRCRKTPEQDNGSASGPIQYEDGAQSDGYAGDQYCLDGQRLKLVSGTHGKNGAEYRTEVESFTRVILIDSDGGNGPNYFQVWRKDGSVSYYGKFDTDADDAYLNVNAKGLTLATAMTWSLSRFEDSAGNYIRFRYAKDSSSGHSRITRIEYSGNRRAGTSPSNHLDFIYESRPDIYSGYMAGARIASSVRLSKILSYGNANNLVRQYSLFYEVGENGMSRVNAIQECVGTQCLPATTFTWAQGALGYGASLGGGEEITSRYIAAKVADVNGDGKQDMIFLHGNEEDYFDVALSDGQRINFSRDKVLRAHSDYQKNWSPMDYNGDGKTDLIYSSGTNWLVSLSTGTSLSPMDSAINTGIPATSAGEAEFVDLNGDGLVDLLYPEGNGLAIRYLTRNPNAQPQPNPFNNRPYVFSQATTANLNLATPAWLTDTADEQGVGDTYTTKLILRDATALPMPVDMNGDGNSDLLVRVKITKRHCVLYGGAQPNIVSPSEQDESLQTDSESATDDGGEVVDIGNGEGGGLKCTISTPGDSWRVLVSDGRGTFTEIASVAGGTNAEFVKLGDFNGDGLTDVINQAGSTPGNEYWVIQLNTGNGFISGGALSGISNGKYLQVIDYDGDGRSDLLYPEMAAEHRYVLRRSVGETFASPEILGLRAAAASLADGQHLFLDLNGDGLLDSLEIDAINEKHQAPSLHLDPFKARGVITDIRNGIGGITHIDYQAMTAGAVYERATCNQKAGGSYDCAPFLNSGRGSPIFDVFAPMYLVSHVESSAPSAGSSPQAVSNLTRAKIDYRYSSLRMQAGGRGSLGFASITTIDTQTNTWTTTSYRQDFPYIGMPIKTEVKPNNGSPVSEANNTLAVLNPTAVSVYPYVQSSVEITKDPATLTELFRVTTTTSYSGDNYGNPTSIKVDTLQNDGSHFIKETVSQYDNTIDGTRWHLGRLKRSTVTTTRAGNSQARTSAFAYDPATGILIREVVEPDSTDSRTKLVTAYELDNFGNRIKTTVCSNHIAETACGSDTTQNPTDPTFINRSSSVAYDSLGRYAVSATNALGQSESVTYHPVWGQPMTKTSANGIVTRYDFDALGRQTTETWADGSVSSVTVSGCGAVPSGYPACPATAVLLSTSQSTNAGAQTSPRKAAYQDLLGRTVREAVQGFDGTWIYSDTEYDVLGRVKFKSEPYFAGQSPSWNRFSYDNYGRVIGSTAASGLQTVIEYTGFDTKTRTLFTNSFTGATEQSRIETKNAQGDVVKVTDTLGQAVTYGYDTLGNLATVTAFGNTISTPHDRLGRKTSMSDPDKGNWQYRYNAMGELTWQQDGKGQTVELTYDRLGRQLSRVETPTDGAPIQKTLWTYDQGNKAIGKLSGEVLQDKQADGSFKTTYSRDYTYDNLGRADTTRVGFDGYTFSSRVRYDSRGRVYEEIDALGGVTRHGYNAQGYANSLSDGLSCLTYWEAQAMDARGHVTSERLGNGVITTRSYDATTGYLRGIQTKQGATFLQQHTYQFNVLGNLDYRNSRLGSDAAMREDFKYDDLNRLREAKVQGGTTLSLSYFGNGNIQTKSDVGTYAYAGGRPHAVSSVSGVKTASYSYDNNGNMTSGDGRTLAYTAFDVPRRITGNGHTTEFRYASDHARYQRIDTDKDGKVTQTYYLGNIELTAKPDGKLLAKRTVGGVAVVTTDSANPANPSVNYLLKDHLGSTDAVVDALGNLVQKFSFDAFGKQRNPLTWAGMLNPLIPLSPLGAAITSRGYTGHEMLDELGLIHMNGRVYDPVLGRFVSADPEIQEPYNLQNLNRYSYVINNPLSYTDPTGFNFFKKWGRQVLAIVAAAVLTWFLGPMAGYLWEQIALGAFIGAVSGAIATGTLRGTVTGALTGAVMGGAVGISQEMGLATKVGIQGTAGGVSHMLQGGKFGHGFVSAGVVAAMGGSITKIGNPVGRVFASAIVGGTVSELTGGKFANGAITAAFQAAVRETVNGTLVGADSSDGKKGDQKGLQRELDKLVKDRVLNESRRYDSADEAAVAVLDVVAPLSRTYGLEVGGSIWQNEKGTWQYTLPEIGTEITGPPMDPNFAAYHTHPVGNGRFSNRIFHEGPGIDTNVVEHSKHTLYVGTQLTTGRVLVAACEYRSCDQVQFGGTVGRIVK